ncbi:MAG: hypothetical protein RMK51_03745 [Meiothermus sp.]|uniref:hypothetical protein n=1 Tax=Meiothermus sp. TaxID=1955249 RepID=UPI0025CD524E|nr:hypothetical protein [Meiothermus sp.]MCS7068241.1 hypothetical protein [Meiothermus sp.]MDW8425022.1 hypothetical protein [Meiothermus sp.]
MKTVFRWGLVYLLLLSGLTALGHYNQQLSARLTALQAAEADRRQKETRLLLERYRLVSPLALQEWAEAHGYIPMSLGRWARPGVEPERSRP